MKLTDAHLHLSDAQYSGHIDELIADARNAGVVALVTNSMDLKSCKNDLKLAETYPSLVYPALGIHPWNVNVLTENYKKDKEAFAYLNYDFHSMEFSNPLDLHMIDLKSHVKSFVYGYSDSALDALEEEKKQLKP